MQPDSCDTFVALPSVTADGCVIFGKNSDRPAAEVQEVIHIPAADHGDSDMLQAKHTHAVILSKPAWLWGAEMGSNEHGVAIGNEAIWTKENGPSDLDEKLLGMDLVRLGLERGSTAHEALDVIAGLLEAHGQGGPCSEEPGRTNFTYHNSFLIADPSEAWVMETAGRHWAAEKITSGVRNISNLMTIGTKIDAMSPSLKEYAQEQGYWDGSGDFNFAKVFSAPPSIQNPEAASPESRYEGGRHLLEAASGFFTIQSMMDILRDEKSGICRVDAGVSATTASMVAALYPRGHQIPSHHWFTATLNPQCSVFKPFVFVDGNDIGNLTQSPTYGDSDPARIKPRFQTKVDRMHALYRGHQANQQAPKDIFTTLRAMENQCIADLKKYLHDCGLSKPEELADLFKDAVESEFKFYTMN